MNTRVRVLVQRRTQCPSREFLSAGARDLHVETLRVVLSPVERVTAVQGNDLVAQDIVAGCNGAGDSGLPGAALVDQFVTRPRLSPVIDAARLNLNPLELRLIRLGAVTIAIGNVSKDYDILS